MELEEEEGRWKRFSVEKPNRPRGEGAKDKIKTIRRKRVIYPRCMKLCSASLKVDMD